MRTMRRGYPAPHRRLDRPRPWLVVQNAVDPPNQIQVSVALERDTSHTLRALATAGGGRIENPRWRKFNYVFYTESDQILHVRDINRLLARTARVFFSSSFFSFFSLVQNKQKKTPPASRLLDESGGERGDRGEEEHAQGLANGSSTFVLPHRVMPVPLRADMGPARLPFPAPAALAGVFSKKPQPGVATLRESPRHPRVFFPSIFFSRGSFFFGLGKISKMCANADSRATAPRPCTASATSRASRAVSTARPAPSTAGTGRNSKTRASSSSSWPTRVRREGEINFFSVSLNSSKAKKSEEKTPTKTHARTGAGAVDRRLVRALSRRGQLSETELSRLQTPPRRTHHVSRLTRVRDTSPLRVPPETPLAPPPPRTTLASLAPVPPARHTKAPDTISVLRDPVTLEGGDYSAGESDDLETSTLIKIEQQCLLIFGPNDIVSILRKHNL